MYPLYFPMAIGLGMLTGSFLPVAERCRQNSGNFHIMPTYVHNGRFVFSIVVPTPTSKLLQKSLHLHNSVRNSSSQRSQCPICTYIHFLKMMKEGWTGVIVIDEHLVAWETKRFDKFHDYIIDHILSTPLLFLCRF